MMTNSLVAGGDGDSLFLALDGQVRLGHDRPAGLQGGARIVIKNPRRFSCPSDR